MGFKLWYEAVFFVLFFGVIIGLPCFGVAVIGTRMVNDLGNFPTKAAQIQSSACWKVLLIELFSFTLLVAFFQIFN